MSAYVEIRELNERVGGFELGPVSLDMAEGEYLVLLGPTGCGKTTLLRSIVGALGVEKERIFLAGEDIGKLPPHRRRVGYVSQAGDLFPHLTAAENVAFGLRYAGIDADARRKRFDRYAGLFGIEKIMGQPATTLSGGEGKKVAMARSLILEPRLLLLDEPLGMLDHNERREMLDVLRAAHNELGTTTIHVTHDRHEAWNIAGECCVMNEGRLIQKATPAELFRAPESRFVAEFLGGANIFPAEFSGGEARLSWATLRLAATPPFARGFLMIRPEQIFFAPGGAGARARGTFAAARDFGEFVECEVKLAGGASGDAATLLVHASVERAAGLKPGDGVSLGWADGSMHPIKE